MAVFVDDAKIPFRRMKCCHMGADTPEELHLMARKLGMRPEWFQSYPEHSWPHYDIADGKRHLAVSLGAVQIRYRELPQYADRVLESWGFRPEGYALQRQKAREERLERIRASLSE